ncbi:MAG: electron transfer flavoprotein subunit alpha/FixB family protein [Bacillota bacterium]|nr:electron transfer flavoprotein subunit alpha/FixB family protein [Bacillota bacterium]
MVWAAIQFGSPAADRDGAEALLAAQQLGLTGGRDVGCLAVTPVRDGAVGSAQSEFRGLLAACGIRRGALLALDGRRGLDADVIVDCLEPQMTGRDAAAWVFPGSAEWRTAAARLAVRLGWPVVGEVIEFAAPDQLAAMGESGAGPACGVVRPAFGGSLLAIEALAMPCLVVIRPRAFAGGPPEGTAIDPEQVDLQPVSGVSGQATGAASRVTVVSAEERQSDLPALGDAEVIVSGGRGLGGPEGFELLTRLARALGGCVGASRAAVDAGWFAYESQVGQSGRTVSPRLYLAVGISGAAQHLAGMRGSRVVVAINRNPEAPIFGACNYGLEGDWREIVTALLDEVGSAGPGGRN